MIKGKQEWKKEETVIAFNVALCECGGEMNDLGSVGCNHDENQTYFYQCKVCKLVQLTYDRIKIENPQELLKAGWTLNRKEE